MGDSINTYVVCYDITVTKFRSKLVKLLKNYGLRLQYSVFVCQMTKDTCEELEDKIFEYLTWKENLIRQNERLALQSASDSICLFSLCQHCLKQVKQFGKEMDFFETDVVL
jgi:CRISPR-associated protein Cas2